VTSHAGTAVVVSQRVLRDTEDPDPGIAPAGIETLFRGSTLRKVSAVTSSASSALATWNRT
jgi:hypothetical protein